MSLEYTTTAEAYETASARLRDTALQARVATFLGNVWPSGFESVKNPKAVYAPYLAKGSQTEVDFLQQIQESAFDSVVATYKNTEYVTANPAAVDCYKPPLLLPKGQNIRQWVVEESERAGALGVAQTKYEGVDIVEYWNGLRNVVLEQQSLPVDDTVVDFGDWYALQAKRFGCRDAARSRAAFYYRALMGLYASGRAVLFDTPPTAFARDVMKPAADIAFSELGVTPLLTVELKTEKREWTDLTFLDGKQVEGLKNTGKIAG